VTSPTKADSEQLLSCAGVTNTVFREFLSCLAGTGGWANVRILNLTKHHPTIGNLISKYLKHIPHRIHGAGIYANIGGILMVNVTIYSSTMDPTGTWRWCSKSPKMDIYKPLSDSDRRIRWSWKPPRNSQRTTRDFKFFGPTFCQRKTVSPEWIVAIITAWWFGTCFIFHNIWDNPSNWLIFFRGVETTNQYTLGKV
jgi:hypothetical protein